MGTFTEVNNLKTSFSSPHKNDQPKGRLTHAASKTPLSSSGICQKSLKLTLKT